MKEISSFAWALEKLKKFNDHILSEPELKQLFVLGQYDFLQAYQVPIFFEFVEYFEKKTRRGRAPDLKDVADTSEKQKKTSTTSVRLKQVTALVISCFSGLFLIISRRRTLVYTADKKTNSQFVCDFRIANLFSYLFKNKVRIFEVFHTTYSESFFDSIFRRKRPAIYLESIDLTYSVLSRIGLGYKKSELPKTNFSYIADAEVSSLFRRLLTKYADSINRSKFRVSFLSKLFKFTNVQTLLATFDTRNFCELVAACNENGIKTYGFQSGNISKYSVGHLRSNNAQGKIIRPNKMMVESGYWKKELLRLGSYFGEGEIEVGGNLKEDYNSSEFDSVKKNEEKLVVLIPYEIAAPKKEILGYIKKLLQYPNLKIIFKMRADRDLKSQAEEYGLTNLSSNLVLASDLNKVDHFDLVAGTYSTFLYEMIGRLKPVVILKTSLDYGEGLIINKLAELVDIEDPQILENLARVAKTSRTVLESRRKVLYGDVIPLDSTLEKVLS